MVSHWVLCTALLCFSLCYPCCSLDSNSSLSNQAPSSFCFLLPVGNVSIDLNLTALVCKPENVNATNTPTTHVFIPRGRASVDNKMGCAILRSTKGYWTYPKVSENARLESMHYPIRLALQESHDHVVALLTAVVQVFPETFGLDRNESRHFNFSLVHQNQSVYYRVCITGTPVLSNSSLAQYIIMAQPSLDLYFVELLRPFLLSLVVLAMSNV
ncbi:ORF3' protein [DeBrazza's monkey arterivirus]|uniref:ORF3' protein n=1 Tax=DeBrazza's monkey arterivirus TaxID=1965063 RepID=A0A0B6C103_9NIDO|nr:ORF3' protein [DeBrazza's monkey arterivirus]AJI43727.1 ORF3' protein [DeBrazza's monkey arterivirus]